MNVMAVDVNQEGLIALEDFEQYAKEEPQFFSQNKFQNAAVTKTYYVDIKTPAVQKKLEPYLKHLKTNHLQAFEIKGVLGFDGLYLFEA